jgi:cytochrome c553
MAMTRMLLTSVGILAWLRALGMAYAAGDAQAGKANSAACAGCHGPNGEGIGSNPPLAGKSEEQIVQALQDYKSGKRANPVMKSIASILADLDMSNIGAYYASLEK